MSTRLLSVQGKVHELDDDLESRFFDLLYEGLHFVKHNKPYGIFLGEIFDQATVDPETGRHSGGNGKAALYTTNFTTMDEQLEFTSKPFTSLIRGLYQLFVSLHGYHVAKGMRRNPHEIDAKNVKKLERGVGITELFDEALQSKDWPTECDKIPDQYLSIRSLNLEQKATVGLSYSNNSLATEPSSSRKRKRVGTAGCEVRRSHRDKRPKASNRR